ncbi:CerR family C-terminal domain-containing protein [Methylovorus mays]|uniref:CerR family C-terminal domain-containing protein n=1 Tax=Methylovorus mays TaxID=184077 RepID=UPI001E4E1BB4|nr:CerR family C-terminal domain-containing protein [Methylovorus mays]MCB5206989.1 CerR family C-terminal domain-containing protein [Methylovorus mays]
MSPPTPQTASRTDGAEARQKILLCALKLFAEKGYAKTSVRQIAQSAQVNVSAISYYFTDKAGLYRTVFSWPSVIARPCEYGFTDPALPLGEALRQFYMEFFQPLKMGEVVQDVMKLRYREMLEPTGVWEQEIESEVKPHHAAMIQLLCRHIGVEEDDEIHSLATGCIGMAVHLYVGHKVIRSLSPQLIDSFEALDRIAERYGRYALAMITDEKSRRADVREGKA